MSPFVPPADRAPSALWLRGFWVYTGAAVVAFILSLHSSTPVDRLLRGVGGVLLLVGGAHQLRVVAYKRATRAHTALTVPATGCAQPGGDISGQSPCMARLAVNRTPAGVAGSGAQFVGAAYLTR